MSGPRLLVVSPPCYQPVNRAVYRELVECHDIDLHLVVPCQLFVGDRWRDAPAGDAEPYELTALNIKGTHGRLRRMQGLGSLAAAWKPTHVLVDSDPASLMTRQAALACPGAKVWALTAENLAPQYGRDLWAGLTGLNPAGIAGPVFTWLMRKFVHEKVDRVFTLSRDGTRVMEAMGFAGRATQIPLGFDPAIFRIQPAEQIAATRSLLGLNQRVIAYFGRLTPEKGVHLLLEALGTLKDLPWQFLIDRFSDYETEYISELQTKIGAMGLSDRVVYFDARHEEMPDFMNAADIVVLPSLSTSKWKEQYGRVLPEAMACGKVVVGSDSGTIPELVAGRGRIFAEGDVPALSRVLRELLLADDLKQIGGQAAVYAHEQLSITRQAEIWAGLLKS